MKPHKLTVEFQEDSKGGDDRCAVVRCVICDETWEWGGQRFDSGVCPGRPKGGVGPLIFGFDFGKNPSVVAHSFRDDERTFLPIRARAG